MSECKSYKAFTDRVLAVDLARLATAIHVRNKRYKFWDRANTRCSFHTFASRVMRRGVRGAK